MSSSKQLEVHKEDQTSRKWSVPLGEEVFRRFLSHGNPAVQKVFGDGSLFSPLLFGKFFDPADAFPLWEFESDILLSNLRSSGKSTVDWFHTDQEYVLQAELPGTHFALKTFILQKVEVERMIREIDFNAELSIKYIYKDSQGFTSVAYLNKLVICFIDKTEAGKNTIQIYIEKGRVLEINGQWKQQQRESGKTIDWRSVDWWEHGYVRRLELPEDADRRRIEACVKNEKVIEIKIPKSETSAESKSKDCEDV